MPKNWDKNFSRYFSMRYTGDLLIIPPFLKKNT